MMRWVFATGLVAASLCLAACQTTEPEGTPCKVSSDCPAGAGVCRSGKCTQVACPTAASCLGTEVCQQGRCAPTPTVTKTCSTSSDCPAGTGVCRGGKCAAVTCANQAGCNGDELCASGQCAPTITGSPGHTVAAGGSVSMSAKHIHVGLTGQGRAVGAGASAAHQQQTGATAVMGR